MANLLLGKFVSRVEDIPTENHWAIIKNESVHTEAVGEWAPGHGYPASTDYFVKYYKVFTNEQEFLKELQNSFERDGSPATVVGIQVTKIYTPKMEVKVHTNGG